LNGGVATGTGDSNILLKAYQNGSQVTVAQVTGDTATLAVAGNITYTGTLTDVSDIRLKKDLVPLDKDSIINRLDQINTYSFRMKADPRGRIEFGVVAQELEKLFPELVETASDAMGTKSVNYVGLIAPLIEASKDLKSKNDQLTAEIQTLKSKND